MELVMKQATWEQMAEYDNQKKPTTRTALGAGADFSSGLLLCNHIAQEAALGHKRSPCNLPTAFSIDIQAQNKLHKQRSMGSSSASF